MRSHLSFIGALIAVALTSIAHAKEPIAEVELATARVRLVDVVPRIASDLRDVDLGPSPASGGSRLIERAELARAIHEAGTTDTPTLPEAVRVVRKMRHLGATDLEHEVRAAAALGALPRGATLASVSAPRMIDVPDGWTTTSVEVPHPPRRKGAFATVATLVFSRDREVVARVSVPIALMLSAESAAPDLLRGASVVLVLQRGLVEVTAPGVAATDADIGALFPVTLYPSGRVIRARLLENGRALATETH